MIDSAEIILAEQFSLIEKMYSDNGLNIILTCSGFPEQYDVFKGDKKVGYIRVRHGAFRVDYPDVMKETIYLTEDIKGDGWFEADERIKNLTIAMIKILEKINDR